MLPLSTLSRREMNIPIVGRIYHVVDRTTGEVVKVGSTIRSLRARFNHSDYKTKYKNHFLSDVKILVSNDLDPYNPEDPYCPFLWHLVASEHLEMIRANTFRNHNLSNKQSPLDQKLFGFFGARDLSVLGGKIGGRKNVLSGHLKSISSKGGQAAGLINGRLNGLILARLKKGVCDPKIASKGGQLGGPVSGRIAVSTGQLASLRTPQHQSAAARVSNHIRWHINRNTVNPKCSLCNERKNNGSSVCNTDVSNG